MATYIAACGTFTKMMLTAIHLTSGQPARATELEVLTWRNTIHRVRSLYFSQGLAFFFFLFFHFIILSRATGPITSNPHFPHFPHFLLSLSSLHLLLSSVPNSTEPMFFFLFFFFFFPTFFLLETKNSSLPPHYYDCRQSSEGRKGINMLVVVFPNGNLFRHGRGAKGRCPFENFSFVFP